MEEDYLGGDGSEADALNATGAGANYTANQSAFDVADNGQVSQGGGTTLLSSPGWMDSLSSLFGSATKVAAAVAPLTGSTTAPAAKVASPTTGGTIAGMSTTSLLMIGGVLLLLGALMFLRKRR